MSAALSEAIHVMREVVAETTIDTEHNFPEVIAFRDTRAAEQERILSHRDEFGQWDPRNQAR